MGKPAALCAPVDMGARNYAALCSVGNQPACRSRVTATQRKGWCSKLPVSCSLGGRHYSLCGILESPAPIKPQKSVR